MYHVVLSIHLYSNDFQASQLSRHSAWQRPQLLEAELDFHFVRVLTYFPACEARESGRIRIQSRLDSLHALLHYDGAKNTTLQSWFLLLSRTQLYLTPKPILTSNGHYIQTKHTHTMNATCFDL